MWTPTTREQYSRTSARYETDLTDPEWAIIEPHMPPPAKRGRPRDWTFREVINGVFYVLRGGIPWRLMPPARPPGQRSIAGSRLGATAGCSRPSTTPWSRPIASGAGAEQARTPRSLAANP